MGQAGPIAPCGSAVAIYGTAHDIDDRSRLYAFSYLIFVYLIRKKKEIKTVLIKEWQFWGCYVNIFFTRKDFYTIQKELSVLLSEKCVFNTNII